MGAPVIAHGDSAPVFEPAEHNFNLMPLFIQIFVVISRCLSVLFGRDAGRNASGKQGVTEPIGVIATVRQKLLGVRGAPHGRINEALLTPLTTEKGCSTQPWLANTPHLAQRSGQGKIERKKRLRLHNRKQLADFFPKIVSPAGPKKGAGPFSPKSSHPRSPPTLTIPPSPCRPYTHFARSSHARLR